MDSSTSNSTQDDDSEWSRNITMADYLGQNGTDDEFDTLYDVPTGVIVLLSFLYGSISVLAVVGNCLVMWVVATSKRMQSVTNFYIANLALADIVIGLFAVPFQFQAALLQRWLLPRFMCPFCPFVQALSVNVSVFTLTAIAVDRHRAIITPLSANISKGIAKLIILVIWVLAFSLAAPMAMSWEVTMVEDIDPETMAVYEKPFCAPTEFGSNSLAIYRLLLYIFQYIIPLCVITFAYAHMAIKLWGTRAPGNAQKTRDANHMKNKKKVIKMLVLVVSLFAFCWLPLQSYLLLQSFFSSINEYRYINVIFFCFDWLAMSNSCYNPFIYAIYNEKFKNEFQHRFTCGKNRKQLINDTLEDAPSVRTKMLSFLSKDRRINRKTANNSIDTNNSPEKTSDQLHRIHNNLRANDASQVPKKTNGDEFRMDTNSLLENKDQRSINNNKINIDIRPASDNDVLDNNDEKFCELYIFPNSNIVEVVDTPILRKT